VTDDLSLDGRVAVVTGAGAGLGRAEALALADAGAAVVVNDLSGAADEAAEEIRSRGGTAAVVAGDVGERSTADAMVAAALDLGGLDIVVNNAGITRDRMLFNLSDEEWDLVIRVHLRGHFLLSRNAAAYWRARSKETDRPVYGRVVNTASEAFLGGSPGQANYAAAKGGIAALTLSTARGLGRIGVRAAGPAGSLVVHPQSPCRRGVEVPARLHGAVRVRDAGHGDADPAHHAHSFDPRSDAGTLRDAARPHLGAEPAARGA